MKYRASEIYHRAKEDVINFAQMEFEHIKDWLIQTGEWDEADDETWEYSPYWLELSGFNKKLVVPVAVMDTATMDTYDEEREIEGFQFDKNHHISVVFEDMDKNNEDAIYLHAFDLNALVVISNLLEEIWNELIHKGK